MPIEEVTSIEYKSTEEGVSSFIEDAKNIPSISRQGLIFAFGYSN